VSLSQKDRALFYGAFRNDILKLTLFPTEQCNFRCTYCYEDFEIGRMSPDTIEGVKALIDTRARELTELHVSWFNASGSNDHKRFPLNDGARLYSRKSRGQTVPNFA